MSRLVAAASRRFLSRHPWQLALAVAGIALGVAVVVGVDLANDSARRSFEASKAIVAGSATHQLVAPGGTVPEALYVQLRTQLGIVRAAPVVEGRLALERLPDRRLTLLGLDPFAEAPFRSYLRPGPDASLDVAALLSEPATVVLPRALARELEVQIGDLLRIAGADPLPALRVAGIVQAGGPGEALLTDFLFTDIASAQELVGLQGRLSRIDLTLQPGEVAMLEAAGLGGAELVDAAASGNALDQMTRAFRLNLTALSLLALVVGVFLIYATMSFIVVRRRPVTGMLRALGATRQQIFATTLREALLLGAVGTSIGLLFGLLLGAGLVSLVLRTIEDLYASVPGGAAGFDVVILLKGALLGLGGTLVAAARPAWEASLTPPRAVLSRASMERQARRRLPVTLAGALACLAFAALVLLTTSTSLIWAFAALFAVIAAAALAAPAATVAFARAVARPAAAVAGPAGRLAARGVEAGLSRTGVAVAALMVAVAAVIGIGLMIGSFRASVADWLELTLTADFYVSPESSVRSTARPTLGPEVVDEIARLPGAGALRVIRHLRIPDTPDGMRVWAVTGVGARLEFDFLAGDPVSARRAFENGEGALVSEPFANKRGKRIGDTITLNAPGGAVALPIVGVFVDYSTDQGVVVIEREIYRRLWADDTVTGIGVFLGPATEPAALRLVLNRYAERRGGLQVFANQEIREVSMAVFDRTFTITQVLRLLAGVVAFLGIFSALQALELERLREVAVLRAIGFTPREVRAVVLGQTALLGLAAGLLAVPIGIALAGLLVFVINERAFGWSMAFVIQPQVLAQGVLLAVVAALLAGLYPALRMTRSLPAADLREE